MSNLRSLVREWVDELEKSGEDVCGPDVHLCYPAAARRLLAEEFKTSRLSGQTCKVCGRRDHFDFNVSDETWAAVVPSAYRSRVVCLGCFDEFAARQGIDYGTEVKALYFVGCRTAIIFNDAQVAERKFGNGELWA